ncbi:phospholipase A2 group XV-like [Ruditapes philippinarum]|uniref:phospholipase A2 group XV-like n=1 Tax=Ruditapes philippinarum TaxID=129788 RepID=UPI00295BD9A2|nr:phospholipase A2 group XV-like [Ruditapes philippinarum]
MGERGFLFLFATFYTFFIVSAKPDLNPVVLIPGDGGSQFKAKLNKTTTVASYCIKKTNYYYDLWLNLEQLVPFLIDCFVDNMRLEYDNVTRKTHNSPGVDIKIPGFGGTDTVEFLDHSEISLTTYFHNIVKAMVSWGYDRNTTLRGAPYDFRKAPNELHEFLDNLKSLIEETYYKNNNKKVVLLGHSMGNPVTLYLLNHMTKAWKSKFIKSFISLAGVWGGAAKPIRLMISGDNLNVPIVKSIAVRREQRSMPSTAWLMPSDQFWGPDEVLVVAPTRNYTVKDYKQLFKDIDYETGYMMWEDTHKLINPLTAPGVEMHCLHGVNVTTPGVFVYTNKTWQQSYPKTIPDNGDGTVNMRSLLGCLRFAKGQSQPVYHKTFDKAEHMQILNRKDVIQELEKILLPSEPFINKHSGFKDSLN